MRRGETLPGNSGHGCGAHQACSADILLSAFLGRVAALTANPKRPHCGRPSKYLQLLAGFLETQLRERLATAAMFFKPSAGCGGSNAKGVTGDAVIGGWWHPLLSAVADSSKSECWWFSIHLDKWHFPWLYSKDMDTSRTIAALEMLGTVFLLRMAAHFGPASEAAPIQLRAVADNQGDVFTVLKGSSTSPLTGMVLMEMVASARWSTAYRY